MPQRVGAGIAIFAVAFTVLWPHIHNQWKQEKSSATTGGLIAENDGKDHSRDPLVIRIGDSGTTIHYVGPISGEAFTSPSGVTYHQGISLERVEGKLLVSATILDRDNNIIATIDKNHWRVAKGPSIWDKNYSDDTLEIQDSRGRVIFQIRLKPAEIELQWEWANDSATGVTGGMSVVGKYSKEKGITPRFLYPSDEHWSELSAQYVR